MAEPAPLQGSDHIVLEGRASQSFIADADCILFIQNLSTHQAYHLTRVAYTVDGVDALTHSTHKYATISLKKGEVLTLENLSEFKVAVMYYRSFALLYAAFALFVISIVGFFVAAAYSITYRNANYFYDAIFSLSVVFEIFFHFYAHKWDYISFSAYCSLFALLLFRNLKIRTAGFGLVILCLSLEAYLWDRVPGHRNVDIATVYNNLVAVVCLVQATRNLMQGRQFLVSITSYANVLSVALITFVYPGYVAIYPLTQCIYIIIFTWNLIRHSVQNERKANTAREEIEHLNASLEIKVIEQTKDIRSLLDNLPQGVLSVGSRAQVLKDYSRVLPSILGTSHIVGADFKSLVIDPIQNLSPDEKDQFFQAILASAGSDQVNFTINEEKLPRLIQHQNRWLQCTYSPIVAEDGSIEKINMTMLDITRERASEVEAGMEREKMTIVAELIKVKSLRPAEFFASMEELLTDVQDRLRSAQKQAEFHEIMIRLHTMKGIARSYAFKRLTDRIHAAEQAYVSILAHQAPFQRNKAIEDIHGIEETLRLYRTIYTETLDHQVESDRSLLQKIDQFMHDLDGVVADQPVLRERLNHIRQKVGELSRRTIQDVIRASLLSVPALAEDLGKAAPDIRVEGVEFPIDASLEKAVKQAFVHIVRNALDHGIEAPAERQRARKATQGQITITLQESEDGTPMIRIHDDGRGLAVARLRAIGLAKGILHADASLEDAAELIFHAGLSTAEKVTDISGRGTGMNAIRNFLQSIGGNARVVPGAFKDPEQTHCDFELIIELPPRRFLSAS